MVRFAIAMLLIVVCVSDADARPRRRGSSGGTYTSTSYSGGPQAVALAKAQRSASAGIRGHLGGGFGGANAEGVGFSPTSAQAALNNCCYTGKRTVAGSAVVRGAGGWYAVKLYW